MAENADCSTHDDNIDTTLRFSYRVA